MISDLTSLLTNRSSLMALIAANAEKTGFSRLLLEKDYYLTILLIRLSTLRHELIFKGGTCLNKCYLGYYRLSEDLDFIHSRSGMRNRNGRKEDFQKVYEIMQSLTDELPGMKSGPPEKFDEHQQMRINISYDSFYVNDAKIKFEVTHRFSLYNGPKEKEIKHLFIHPVTGVPYGDTGRIHSISLEEAAAEKVRACLTRKVPAIRDFFDLWYIKEYTEVNLFDKQFIALALQKLRESTGIIDLARSMKQLQKQIDEELKPTLNKEYSFNLDKMISYLKEIV